MTDAIRYSVEADYRQEIHAMTRRAQLLLGTTRESTASCDGNRIL